MSPLLRLVWLTLFSLRLGVFMTCEVRSFVERIMTDEEETKDKGGSNLNVGGFFRFVKLEF